MVGGEIESVHNVVTAHYTPADQTTLRTVRKWQIGCDFIQTGLTHGTIFILAVD